MSFAQWMGWSAPKMSTVDTSRLTRYGEQFLDPSSQLNKQNLSNLRQTGLDSLAQQYLMSNRMRAAGQNPFAGGQYRAGLSDMLGQTYQAQNQYMNQAYGLGSGLLGQALQGEMANITSKNQAALSGMQNRSDFFTNLFGQGMQALPTYLFGGVT